MNTWGLFIVLLGLALVWLGITAKAGDAITHVKSKAS